MKKIISLLLVMMLVVSLAACGGSSNEPAQPAAEPADNTPAAETPAEEPADETPGAIAACYGDWRLVNISGGAVEEKLAGKSDAEKEEFLKGFREMMRFELGEESYFVMDDVWNEIELIEAGDVITATDKIYGNELEIRDGVLTLSSADQNYEFEKVSDTPQPNPYWYYGDYELYKIKMNESDTDWRDPEPDFDPKFCFISIYGITEGMDWLLPDTWRGKLDLDNMTLTATVYGGDESRTDRIEFIDKGLLRYCDGMVLWYYKAR